MAKNALEKYEQLVQEQGQVLLDVVQSVALGDLNVEIEVPEGVEVLSDLAIGIEMMVDDIREMLAEQERAAAEIEQARRQAETALQETLALQQRYLGYEWQSLLMSADQGYFRSKEQEGPTDEVWLPAMTEAVQQVTSVTEDDEQGATLAVPLHLYGQVIGALGLTRPGGEPWNPDDIHAVQEIVEQVAWALENQRLFDDAQLASLLMGQRVNELDCLNAIGRKIDKSPPIAEFLEWAAQRIPAAMRYPDICQVAIKFEGQVYGVAEALELPRQIVAGMYIGGERLGQITIAYTKDHDFINEESALMGDIIRRVSGYIEKQRLFDQAQARAREQTVLSEMGRALSARLDVDAVVRNIHRHASRLVDATNFYIALYDAQRNEISFPIFLREGQEHQQPSRRAGKGLTEHVIQTCEPLLIQEAVSVWLQEQGIEFIGLESYSWLGVPMMVGEQVIGVIAVQSYTTPHLYDEHDRDLLAAIASQAAIAITNARLFSQAQTRAQEQTTLSEMGRALSARLDVDAVVRNIHRYTSRVMDATSYYVALYDAKQDVISFPLFTWGGQERQQESRRSGKGLTEHVIQSREPLLIKEDVLAWLQEQGIEAIGLEAHSWLGVPMMEGEQVIGVIAVQSDTISRLYDEHDRDLLVAIASQAAIAITNANLFEQTQVQLADLTTIQQTTSELTAALTFDEAVVALLSQVANAAQVDTVSMFLIEGELMRRVGRYPDDESVSIGQTIALADYPLTQRVIETRQANAITADDPRLQEHARQSFKAAGITANATIPLIGREGVLGTLALSSQQPGRVFAERDLQILQTLADQATIAIERLRLLEETARRAHRERTLREITARVRGSTNPDVIVRTAVRELGSALGRPTFVRLGSVEQLVRETGGNGGDQVPTPSGEGGEPHA